MRPRSWAALAVLVGGAALAACSPQPAQDGGFQDALAAEGVAGYAAFGDRLDDAGRAVCADLRGGLTVAQLARQAHVLDPEDRVPFVRTAARTFCPEVPA